MSRSTLMVALAMTGFAIVLFLLERVFPLRRQRRRLLARLCVNIVAAALVLATAATIIRPTTQGLLDWTKHGGVGLLAWIEFPSYLSLILAFLLMDVSFYYWHWANHRLPFLWRFHVAHHSDPDLDVSTALRFHPGEIAVSAAFRIAQIVIIGPSPMAYAIYEGVFQAATLFHHSNVRLPFLFERWLNLIIVTPRMHGIHHSNIRDETNSNYSVIFSWWDRIHRSARLNIPQSDIVIGVPAYAGDKDNHLLQVLILPLCRQRSYWTMPNGSSLEHARSGTANRAELIE
jgi:sterol desaturase/sphingolipid hydroxylase (fatty acid hydroxylase superfamily)